MQRGVFRIFFIFVFALVLIPSSFAVETLLVSTNVYSYDTVTVSGRPFVVILEDNYDRIVARYNNFPYFITIGKCEEITNLLFCFNETDYDATKNVFFAKIKVYDVAPKITVTRTANQTNLHVDEDFKITVSLKNEGNLTADNFTYVDDFPAEFDVLDTDGMVKVNGTKLYWTGILKRQETETFSYVLRVKHEFEDSLKASYEYHDGYEMKKLYTSAIALKVTSFLSMIVDIVSTGDQLYVGDVTPFVITLTNTHGSAAMMHYLDIALPASLEFVATDVVRVKNGTKVKRVNATTNKTVDDTVAFGRAVTHIGNNVYRFSGAVKRNPSKADLNKTYIVLKLKGVRTGEASIKVLGMYAFNDEYKEETVNHTIAANQRITVKNPGIDLLFNFKDGDSYDAGQVAPVNIQVVNLHQNRSVYNVYASIESAAWTPSVSALFPNVEALNNKYYIDKIGPKVGRFILKDKNILFTQVPAAQTFSVKINVSYQSEFGENFSKEVKTSVQVKPIVDLLVERTLSSKTLSVDDELKATITVQNDRNAHIKKVFVNETLPIVFTLLTGVTGTRMDVINAKTKVTSYIYTLKMPHNLTKETEYTLRTDVKYEENNKTYVYYKEDKISVSPKELDIALSKTFANGLVFGLFEPVVYTLSNPESEPIYNITLTYTPQQYYDLYGNTSFSVPKLDPGETILVKNQHMILPKANVSASFAGVLVSYYDGDGRFFEAYDEDESISVLSSFVTENMYTLEKTSTPATLTLGDPLTVSLKATNLGPKTASVILIDEGREWNITLQPTATRTVTYTYTPLQIGDMTLSAATINYTYQNRRLLATSNKPALTITPKKESAVIDVSNAKAQDVEEPSEEPALDEALSETDEGTESSEEKFEEETSEEDSAKTTAPSENVIEEQPEKTSEEEKTEPSSKAQSSQEKASEEKGFFALLRELWQSLKALVKA